jgi:hypothetical protein
VDVTARGTVPVNGVLIVQFVRDPRLSSAQMKALDATARTDAGARVMGLDENYLPVIQATIGNPPQRRVWAVRRNGDPCTPGKVTEKWTESRS